MANNQPTMTREQALSFYKSDLFTKLGKSGIILQNGVISREEYNKKLEGKKGLEIYNEMRSSDGTVRAALMAVMLPILGAPWSIQEKDDDPRSMLAKQIVEECLFNRISFDDFARQALTFLPFGFSLFEQVFTIDTFEGRQYMLLDDMAFRKQTSLLRWVMESTGEPGITQHLVGGGKAEIPDIKLTRFTFEQEGDNFEGRSLLRAAYKHWYMKTEMEIIDGMRHEKQGLGILKVRTPITAKEEDKEEARNIAREQRANESNFIEEEEGYNFEFMDMKARNTTDIVPSINYHNRQILQSVLAQFLDLGSSGSSGSLAASDNQLDLFYKAEEAIAKNFKGPMNDTVIRNICDLNGLQDHYPTLEYGRIDSDTISVFSEALNKMLTSGAVTPDPDTEQYIREFLHLPPMSDDMIERYDEIRAQRKNPAMNPTEKERETETTPTQDNSAAQSAAADENIQQQVLNGAQIKSLTDIVIQYIQKQIPYETALRTLKAAFPLFTDDDIKAILDPATNFDPAGETDKPEGNDPGEIEAHELLASAKQMRDKLRRFASGKRS